MAGAMLRIHISLQIYFTAYVLLFKKRREWASGRASGRGTEHFSWWGAVACSAAARDGCGCVRPLIRD